MHSFGYFAIKIQRTGKPWVNITNDMSRICMNLRHPWSIIMHLNVYVSQSIVYPVRLTPTRMKPEVYFTRSKVITYNLFFRRKLNCLWLYLKMNSRDSTISWLRRNTIPAAGEVMRMYYKRYCDEMMLVGHTPIQYHEFILMRLHVLGM